MILRRVLTIDKQWQEKIPLPPCPPGTAMSYAGPGTAPLNPIPLNPTRRSWHSSPKP